MYLIIIIIIIIMKCASVVFIIYTDPVPPVTCTCIIYYGRVVMV